MTKPPYKLRFPGSSEFLLFTEAGALLIEKEDYSRPYDEVYDWIEPEDTIRFLEAIGETGRRPEFVEGEPTPQTKAMLRRILKQFSSTDDLYRCWNHIGVHVESFHWRDSD